jgi:hypothetical protein
MKTAQPYRVSRDYSRLLHMLSQRKEIVCFVDYKFPDSDNEPSRDICTARCYPGRDQIQIAARGITYNDCLVTLKEPDKFFSDCQRMNLEFIDPPKDDEIEVSFRKGCPTCLSPQPHLHPAVQHEGEVSICKDPFHSQLTPQNPKVEMPVGLQWGEHQRDGGTHIEWFAPCGCSYHPQPFPHVHPCSDAHRRDLEERAIVVAAREWATAWGKVWDSDESATTEAVNEVDDKSKALHDAVLALEREIVLRRRRKVMPGYDKALEEWLS